MTERPSDHEIERRLAALYSHIEHEQLPAGLANLTARDFSTKRPSRFRPVVLGSLVFATAAAVAVTGIVIHNAQLASAPAMTPSPTSVAPTPSPVAILPATTATPAPTPTSAELLAVAEATMSPTGRLCDTHRDTAPSDVNSCPYTPRLKSFVDALDQRAFAGQGNPNPVLSAGSGQCAPVVGYQVRAAGNGGTVALETGCPGGAPTPAYQKVVIVQVGRVLLVDDILIDAGHNGSFVSIYSTTS
jgi:hypothetical protein